MSLELRNIEFYGTPSGDVMVKEEGKPVRVFSWIKVQYSLLFNFGILLFVPRAPHFK